MSQFIQQQMHQIHQAVVQFTMQSDAFIMHLHATDNDFKPAYHLLTTLAQHKFDSPDVFILMDAPFENNAEHYANSAIVELCKSYDLLKPSLPVEFNLSPGEKGLSPWQPEFILNKDNTPPETGVQRLQRLIKEFVALHGDYFDKLVLFFTPSPVSSHSQWTQFIKELSPVLSNKVRLGVIENLTPFAPVAAALQLKTSQVYHYSFQGQSYDAMLSVIDELDNQDHITDIQRYLTQTFKYQQTNEPQKALQAGTQALKLAQQHQLKETQVIALSTLYAVSVSMQDYKQAQQQAQLALECAQTISVEELEQRDQLEAMAQANLATAALINRDYKTAASTYQSAAKLFWQQENWMMAYENLRLSALCFTQIKQYATAWEQTEEALVAFYQTPEALWQQSTLPYLASNMQQTKRHQDKAEWPVFERHMAHLLGEEWQQQVKQLGKVSLPKSGAL